MKSFKVFFGTLIPLAVVAAPFVVWWQWHAIYDWARLRDYTPPQAISALVSQDTMTAYGQHLFYVNHPQLVSGVAAFRQDCPESEQTIVLGCYHPNMDGIYVYNVTDSQLYGIQQVTAAHEMLHGAYARLSAKERAYVDGLLNNFYTNDEHDQRIINEINLYKKTEPNSVMDEMHSTLGTELVSLSPALETYYQQYFTNRLAVANFANSYEAAFTSRTNQVSADDAQLASMKQNISTQEQLLQTQLNQINSDRARLNQLSSSGQTDAYNAGVDSFNGEVDAYNSGVDQLRSDITAYNNLVSARNNIASALASLDQAIDTRLTPQATQ
jgi:uncharacterized protein YdaU (DUF1376 family)